MPFDAREFRNALGCFPTGVVVVAARAGSTFMGITVNSFASVSLDPPLVMWCVDRKSRRYDAFTTVEEFTISVLSTNHEKVSARLATPGEHSLDGVSLIETQSGTPGLADALAVLECRREAVHAGGDHSIVVGRVVRFAWRQTGRPLVFFRGRYGGLAESG